MLNWLYVKLGKAVAKIAEDRLTHINFEPIINKYIQSIDFAPIVAKIDFEPMIEKMMQDSRFQDNVIGFTDELFERYKIKAKEAISGTLGKMQATGNNMAEGAIMPTFLNKKGQLDTKALIGLGLQMFLGGQKEGQTSNRLP